MSVIELRHSVQKVVDSEGNTWAALVPWPEWEKIKDILDGLERIHWVRYPDAEPVQSGREDEDSSWEEPAITLDELLVMVNEEAPPINEDFFESED
jgi:hypothetical protein